MNSLPMLSGNAALPSPATAPAPAGAVPADGAAGEGEVLSVAELLRLLEQGAGPGALPTEAGATAAAAPARPAGAGCAEADSDDEPPCDIVTLLRLLEQPGAPAYPATPAGTAAPAAAAVPTLMPAGAGEAQPPQPAHAPRPRAAAGGGGAPPLPGTAATLPPPGGPEGGLAAEMLRLAPAQGAAGTAAEGRGAARDTAVTHTAGIATPLADPAPALPGFAEQLRSDPPAAAQVERSVRVAVRDPAWPQAVAAEIRLLSDRRIEAATLRLSPEHLGPLEIRIDMRDGQVSVNFGVAHPDTQSVLEQALPRLREMLAAAGLELGQASVRQEMRQGSHNGGASAAEGDPAADNQASSVPAGVRALGLIDDYA